MGKQSRLREKRRTLREWVYKKLISVAEANDLYRMAKGRTPKNVRINKGG